MAVKPSKNLTAQAYEAIKESIMLNRLKQGDYISENALAKELGMSRTPVREAIRILDSEGLIEVRNGVGIFVRHILSKEIYDIFEMRALLECSAARSAMYHISATEIRQMKEMWKDMENRLENGERITENEISSGYDQLHSLLVERCENKVLAKMDHDIHLQVVRLRNIFISSLEDTRQTIRQHLEIVDCMERGDVDQLVNRLKQHMEQSAEHIIRTRSFVIG